MRWAVIGGGILGMRLGQRLAERGHSVDLYESAPETGGLASAWKLGDITWDRHYHVTSQSDTHVMSLLAELGIDNEMQWRPTRTGFYSNGQLYSMSNSVEFLGFPLLGLLDKVRLAATILYASRIKDWKRLEEIPVSTWLTRLSGRRTFERFWLPLLRAKLGEQYQQTSAAFIWATIARMYSARQDGMKRERFGFVTGGYAQTLERFTDHVRKAGVQVHTNHPARRVSSSGSGVRVEFDEGAKQFDRVVLTLPGPVAAAVCSGLTEKEAGLLGNLRYQGIVCASVLSEEPVSDCYITNITDPGHPFTGIIEMSALTGSAMFGGRSLIYLPKYVAPNDEIFERTDEEIREQFLGALRKMYPGFQESRVIAFRVSRVRHVFPIPTLRYSSGLPPVKTSMPGVYVANSAHIVNGTLNVNETLDLAERAMNVLEDQMHG